jgi:hypothetical protein
MVQGRAGVHGGLRAAQEGREAGQRVGVGQALQVGRRVQRLDGDAVGRDPVQRIDVAAGGGLGGGFLPLLDGDGLEFGLGGGHRAFLCSRVFFTRSRHDT